MIDWKVSAEGAVFGSAFVDGAGDAVNTMTVQGPVERIAVLVEGTVETRDTAGMLRTTARSISPRVYLQSDPRRSSRAAALIELKDAALKGVEARPPAGALAPAGRRGGRRDRLRAGRDRTPTPPPPRRWSRAGASARTWRMR